MKKLGLFVYMRGGKNTDPNGPERVTIIAKNEKAAKEKLARRLKDGQHYYLILSQMISCDLLILE